jgi:predicted Zn-dependent protease
MAQAGYSPEAAIPFWLRMAGEGGGEPPEFLSTHPSHETRIEQIREYLPEAMQYYQPQG